VKLSERIQQLGNARLVRENSWIGASRVVTVVARLAGIRAL